MEFSQIIKWKRFSHSPYAVFCSLHKVINIGVLSVAIIANADAKSSNSREEEDPVYYETLDDIEVTAVKEGISINGPDVFTYAIEKREIQTAPQPSVNDVLKQVPEVDVRQRGAFGIQTDISIKGATPEQSRINLNGINISSPQTGHLSANFPVSIGAVKQIEISEGKGENDAINIVAKPDTNSSYETTVHAGFNGTFGVDNIINIHTTKHAHLINGAFYRSDGATINSDFRTGNFYYTGQTNDSPIHTEWQIGYSRKSFGANTFYSPSYDNQWERTNRLLSSAKIETATPVNLSVQFSWCRDYDHFQLVRDEHFGENYHRTNSLFFSPELKKHWGKGVSTLKLNYRHERILSTNLGLPEIDSIKIFGSDQYYKKSQGRETFEMHVEHQHKIKRWGFDAGLHYTQAKDIDHRHAFLPFFKTTYMRGRTLIILSLNNAIRMPSFTDLFYKSPVNTGNTGLKNEKKTTGQLTVKHNRRGFYNEGFIYHTIGKEMIDWVMYTSNDTYHSANFGLRNTGFGYHAELKLADFNSRIPVRFGLGYQHIWQKRKDNVYIYKSMYALEYLRNKVTTDVTIQPIQALIIRLDTRFIERIGNYILYENHTSTGNLQPYKPYCISDLEISYQTKWGKLFTTINNLFNKKYVDFGNVAQAGFYGQIGINVHVGSKRN
ncbi:MAG: TonB-dependent receptor plug domain-containing protein [Paludibacteraceae bacterium]|nr:TonB-dependent receptor plug domain-containing protein [Paludibacteraceae bacterium]